MSDKMKKTHRRPRHAAPDDGDAFVPDAARSHQRLFDDAAESFAEEFIASATSAEFVGEDARDEWSEEEIGGPFLERPFRAWTDLDAFTTEDESGA